MTREERQAARLLLGDAAVLSPAVASELLPFSDQNARAWLRKHGLVHSDPELGEYVVWREVLDRLQYGGPRPSPTRSGSLPSAGLEPRRR